MQTYISPPEYGYKTDRGRFYIVHGPPDKTDYLPYGTDSQDGSKTPYNSEVWHYGYIKDLGRDVVIWFVDIGR